MTHCFPVAFFNYVALLCRPLLWLSFDNVPPHLTIKLTPYSNVLSGKNLYSFGFYIIYTDKNKY